MKKINVTVTGIVCLTCLWITIFCLPQSMQAGEQVLQNLELVFTADFGEGEQVFFSGFGKNGWSSPLQISDGDSFVFHPAIASSAGKKWVVWTEVSSDGRFLHYSFFNGSHWGKALRISSGMNDNRSASLIVDASGVPWLAWCGVEKRFSDIFWSRWTNSKWTVPVKAHGDNNVPDVDPALSLDDEGRVTLTWRTFANGRYVTLSKSLNGERQEQQIQRGQKRMSADLPLPSMPTFIKERHKARLFIETNHGSESISLDRYNSVTQ